MTAVKRPRWLRVTDADRIAEIHAQSFEKGWPALELSIHLERDICLGLCEPIQSFVVLRVAASDAEILTLATDPSHLRQGLAQKLLLTAETELRDVGVRTVFLEVAEDNLAAIALYKRSGFTPMGRRPGYYRRASGRMAALTFSKNL